MSKFFTTLTFAFFLLFQTTALAEEELAGEHKIIMDEVPEDIPSETLPPEEDASETEEPTQAEEQEATENVGEESEKTEEISEAQREAQAAEEAELREAGVGEEPEAE